MDGQHPRVTAEHVRVARRTSQDLSPVGGEVLDVMRVETMGKGVVELRILKAAFVGRGRQGEEGLLASGVIVEGRTRHSFSSLVSRGARGSRGRSSSSSRRTPAPP